MLNIKFLLQKRRPLQSQRQLLRQVVIASLVLKKWFWNILLNNTRFYTLFLFLYFISDNLTYHSNTYCYGDHDNKHYASLVEAKVACANSVECHCMMDGECDGGPWLTFTGYPKVSSTGSCAWVKRKLTFLCHGRKLMYQKKNTWISIIWYLTY